MKGLLRRPLAAASALFLLLLFTTLRCGSAYALPLCIGAVLLACLPLGFGVGLAKAGSLLRRNLFFCAGLLMAASLSFLSAYRVDQHSLHQTLNAYDSQTGQLQLTVTEAKDSTVYSASFLCRLDSFDGSKTKVSGRIRLPYAAELSPGDRITTVGRLTVLSPQGETLAECYDYSQGIFFEAVADDGGYRLLSKADETSVSALTHLKNTIRRQLYPYLSDTTTGLVSALLTGDKSGLSSELSRQFRNLGISHTLAVSGLHLSILCGSLLWLFRKFCLPRRLRFPILLPILLFYMLLVGSPSVYRAGGMTLLFLISYHFGRRSDALTSLFSTVALICLISPESVLDVGLLLSFFATMGILLLGAPLSVRLQKLPALPRYVLSALILTGSATLFTLPFSVWYFGEWAMLSPLANLLLVPLITGLLYLAPLLLLLSRIPFLAFTPALLIELLSALLQWAGAFFGSNNHLLLPLQYSFIQTSGIFAAVLTVLLYLIRKTRPFTVAVAALFLAVAGGYCTYHATLLTESAQVVAVREENIRYLAIRAGTRVLLVDHSVGAYSFWDNAVAASQNDPLIKVDALLLTDYHYQQIAKLTRFLEKGDLEYLILPTASPEDHATARVLAERAKSVGCQVLWYSSTNCCVGYHDIELRFSYEPWDPTTPRRVTVYQDGNPTTYAFARNGKSAE